MDRRSLLGNLTGSLFGLSVIKEDNDKEKTINVNPNTDFNSKEFQTLFKSLIKDALTEMEEEKKKKKQEIIYSTSRNYSINTSDRLSWSTGVLMK